MKGKRFNTAATIKEYKLSVYLAIIVCWSCGRTDDNKVQKLFTLMRAGTTGIAFSNNIHYSEELNPYTFRNFFNGGGVAIGDINNDKLPDIFFCSNQQSNTLYLNKGDFRFEDISQQAGIKSAGAWSTGVTMADINGDGLLDIYVCRSADRDRNRPGNELFINNGDLTFTPMAGKMGIDSRGLSTHAAFFDYDNDGDLDCYLLNNSLKSVGNFDLVKDERLRTDSLGGNKLYRNDDGHFTDVTAGAGIYSSRIGFGLGVTVSDIDKDGWQDIYVSNDFFERDYLYINRQNGRFEERAEQYIRELSMNSMGADVADINNDALADIYVTDMFPEKNDRIKSKTSFETWEKYSSNISNGYYKQFVRNVLQLNDGATGYDNEISFSEIGRYSNTSATDWSWGALITDLDNDGFKDIFVANGIAKDITDQDYIQFTSGAYADIRQQIINKEKNIIKRLVDLIPSEALPNYAFKNRGDLTFVNQASEWGLDEPSFSNGSAYGDLDGDGDLDLVVNNVNMPCFVYRNESVQQHPENKFVKVSLRGKGKNRFGLGSKVTVYYNGKLAYQEQMPMRGFESTVDCCLNFGLGKCSRIDSVVVEWPDGKRSVRRDLAVNGHIAMDQGEAEDVAGERKLPPGDSLLFTVSKDKYGLDFVHRENNYVDFDRERLSYQMLSTQGPRMARGDVNRDGLEDIYIGGAKGQSGAMYVQTVGGRFKRTNELLFEKDRGSEDTDALFFDADGDGDSDLYVCSGGSEFSVNSTDLISRLYINEGTGKYHRSPQVLPGYIFESSSCVRAGDYDGDGDLDLFTGVRLKPLRYGYPCKGYILQNDGHGNFKDVSEGVSPALASMGMITDAQWLDYDLDGKADLAITGEYMAVRLFHNEGGKLKEVTEQAGLGRTHGWWNRLVVADINGDGYADLVGANHGLNSRFRASEIKPVRMYVSDFDNNGTVEQIITSYNGDSSYPVALRHDLVGVLPVLKKKYLHYKDYQGQTISDIFSTAQLEESLKLEAYELRSCVFMNDGRGRFIIRPLCREAQLSVMYGICVSDVDRDGRADIVLGGNFYESKPEAGIYDASYGVVLKGDGTGDFRAMPATHSGVHIRGAVRDIIDIGMGRRKRFLWALNNGPLTIVDEQ